MAAFEQTFNQAAEDYEQSRPLYVQALYEDIFRYKPVDENSHVLEIGLGTGKATRPFLEAGCRLTGVEPGADLARLALERLRGYDRFTLRVQTLQDFQSPGEAFDLVYAATAFHWLPEEYGYRRVYALLKRGGAFARFAYHAGPDPHRTALAEEIQAVYRACKPSGGAWRPFSAGDAAKLADLAAKYGFVGTKYSLYEVEKTFTADEYGQLLRTYPDHMALEAEARARLFAGIHEAIERHGGVITVAYTMDLELAAKP